MRRVIAAIVALGAAGLAMAGFAAAPASALELDPVGSFDRPVFVTSSPTDPDQLFVVEQPGRIVVEQGGATHAFLDISGDVNYAGEQGLLSMAFDPGYATNRRFYIEYAGTPPSGGNAGNLHVVEYKANAAGTAALPASRRQLLVIPHTTFQNHNGGQLQFGPDGYLYISTGDGGGGGDSLHSGQDTGTLLGKILRIDPNPDPVAHTPYTVPADNPFAGGSGNARLIWAYGVRNPWRFSFDAANGALVIGDVGQNAYEEIDYAPQPPLGNGGRGDNFGWNCREGFHDYSGAVASCATSYRLHRPDPRVLALGRRLRDHRRLHRPRPGHARLRGPLPVRGPVRGADPLARARRRQPRLGERRPLRGAQRGPALELRRGLLRAPVHRRPRRRHGLPDPGGDADRLRLGAAAASATAASRQRALRAEHRPRRRRRRLAGRHRRPRPPVGRGRR